MLRSSILWELSDSKLDLSWFFWEVNNENSQNFLKYSVKMRKFVKMLMLLFE